MNNTIENHIETGNIYAKAGEVYQEVICPDYKFKNGTAAIVNGECYGCGHKVEVN